VVQHTSRVHHLCQHVYRAVVRAVRFYERGEREHWHERNGTKEGTAGDGGDRAIGYDDKDERG